MKRAVNRVRAFGESYPEWGFKHIGYLLETEQYCRNIEMESLKCLLKEPEAGTVKDCMKERLSGSRLTNGSGWQPKVHTVNGCQAE